MANWANPTVTSNYITFVDEVKNRDIDAITLQAVAVTNPPVSSIRLVRAPVKFQEWNGTSWVDKLLSPEGGGTGSNSLSGISGQLGLGTMAYQNANAINVTGGQVASINIVNCALSGTASYAGSGMNFYSQNDSVPVNIQGSATNWPVVIRGDTYGVYIISGNGNKGTYPFLIHNAAQNQEAITVRGDMNVLLRTGLVIPVGANRYVPV